MRNINSGTSSPHCTAKNIARGTLRLLSDFGKFGLTEVTLANNRRADILALGKKGKITIIEIKSSIADFRADNKWHEYLPFCDEFYFAVGDDFPQSIIPEEAGLIIADAFGGAILRSASKDPLNAARRKAVTLRFARLAAQRWANAAFLKLDDSHRAV